MVSYSVFDLLLIFSSSITTTPPYTALCPLFLFPSSTPTLPPPGSSCGHFILLFLLIYGLLSPPSHPSILYLLFLHLLLLLNIHHILLLISSYFSFPSFSSPPINFPQHFLPLIHHPFITLHQHTSTFFLSIHSTYLFHSESSISVLLAPYSLPLHFLRYIFSTFFFLTYLLHPYFLHSFLPLLDFLLFLLLIKFFLFSFELATIYSISHLPPFLSTALCLIVPAILLLLFLLLSSQPLF